MVFAVSGGMARLGVWQLDRLAQRREFNAHVLEQRAAEVLELGTVPDADLPALLGMEFRSVMATGIYDFDCQVALRNQYWEGQYGYALMAPLLMEDGRAVLVERGWIPAEYDTRASWGQFDENGTVRVQGVIRIPQAEPDMGGVPDPTPVPGQAGLDFWNIANLERIQEQILYPLMPVYIQKAPNEEVSELPQPLEPDVVVTEGNHLGYAVQWFTYASLLFFGYPLWLRRQEKGA